MNEQIATMVTGLLRSAMETVNTSMNHVTLTQNTTTEAFRTQAADAQQVLGEVQVWLSDLVQRMENQL